MNELNFGTEPETEPWKEDFLGPAFQFRTLALAPDDEGEVCATLVRYSPPGMRETTGPATSTQGQGAAGRGVFSTLGRLLNGSWKLLALGGNTEAADRLRHPELDGKAGPTRVVLYLHGWADYFLQAELAEQVAAAGYHFYALDLRKFGRSLREWQTAGFTSDLAVYDEDLDAALAAIRAELTPPGSQDRPLAVHLVAHSLGGLVAALWADRHPGELRTLILNAPWLELQGSSLLRNVAMHLVDPVARADPRRPFRLPDMPGYWQSVSSEAHGEWHLDPAWRPAASFPIRAGWAKAVLAGHAAVERRLDIRAPVLVLLSDRTRIQSEWSVELMRSDAVIDVEETARKALRLGRRIAVFRYPGAIHDVFLSRRRVRQEAYTDLTRWLDSYPD